MASTDRLLWIAYLLIPFAVIGNATVMNGQYYAVIFCIVLGVFLHVKDEWLRGGLIYFAIWQGVLFPLSLFYSRSGRLAMNSFEMFVATGLLALLFLYLSRSKFNLDRLYDVICISALLHAVNAWLQWFGLNLTGLALDQIVKVISEIPGVPTSTFQNNNFLAAYLAISTLFFWETRKFEITLRPRKKFLKTGFHFERVINWRYGLIIIIPVFFPLITRTAVIALGAGAVAYWWQYWKVMIPAAVSISTLYMLFSGKGIPVDGLRYEMWSDTWAFMKKSFFRCLIGNSPGTIIIPNLHNEYLTIFVKFGLMGLVFLGGYIKNLYRGDRMLFSVMVVALVNMIGNFPMEQPANMILITITAGLIERKRLENEKNN